MIDVLRLLASIQALDESPDSAHDSSRIVQVTGWQASSAQPIGFRERSIPSFRNTRRAFLY
jgi:hypothetical protein